MPESHSRSGKPVELMKINDDPHERYRVHHPMTGERLEGGIPILTKARGGEVVEKDVTYFTVKCPECREPAEYNHQSEPICPICGIICVGESTILSKQMVRDAKAAGRRNGDTQN